MTNVTVKPLEWWEPDHTNNYTHGAKTIIGTYYVHIDGGRHIGCMETFVNDKIEQWEGPERGHLYEAQSDCFANYEIRILSALSVPCLQEPTLIQHRVHFDEDGKPTEWRDGEGVGYPDSPLLRVEVRKLYTQPIEVREQAIREWQPISTAPKDRTKIWVLDSLYSQPWHYECVWNGIQWYHGFGRSWPRANPTHWMPPLPLAPLVLLEGR